MRLYRWQARGCDVGGLWVDRRDVALGHARLVCDADLLAIDIPSSVAQIYAIGVDPRSGVTRYQLPRRFRRHAGR